MTRKLGTGFFVTLQTLPAGLANFLGGNPQVGKSKQGKVLGE